MTHALYVAIAVAAGLVIVLGRAMHERRRRRVLRPVQMVRLQVVQGGLREGPNRKKEAGNA